MAGLARSLVLDKRPVPFTSMKPTIDRLGEYPNLCRFRPQHRRPDRAGRRMAGRGRYHNGIADPLPAAMEPVVGRPGEN